MTGKRQSKRSSAGDTAPKEKRMKIATSSEDDNDDTDSDFKPAAKEVASKPPSKPLTSKEKKYQKESEMIASMKKASHNARVAEKKKTPEPTPMQGKYWYLEKKDWDDYVIEDVEESTLIDYPTSELFKLSDLVPESKTLTISEADFSETQTNMKKAKKEIRKIMNVPTKAEYEDQRAKIEDPFYQDQWKQFYNKATDLVETETSIHNYASVVELGWQPDDPQRPFNNKEKKLKGHYILKVRMAQTGEIKEVIPIADWVVSNFSEKALATVQKAFYSYYEKVPVKYWADCKKIDYNFGFVDVENEEKYVVFNDDQINKLKYIPSRKTKVGNQFEVEQYKPNPTGGSQIPVFAVDKDGNRIRAAPESKKVKIIEEKWLGYSKKTNKVEELTSEFVQANFTQGYIDQVKHLCKSKSKRWVAIPPGDAKTHENVPDHLQSGPTIKYRQTMEERYCLVYSFASALHHIGLHQIASETYQAANHIVEKHNTFHLFSLYMKSKAKQLFMQKLKRTKWNILENGDKDLVIVSIRSRDGKEDHCVTLFGKWIFDSNFPKALPLCMEALDLCCSSDTIQDKFECVVEARKVPQYGYLLSKKK